MTRAWRAQQPTCLHGHPFPDNLRTTKNGATYCFACHTERQPPATVDPVAVQRAVAGDAPEYLNYRERAAAIRQLDARGLTTRQIAEHVGCSTRTVERVRARKTTA